MGAVGLRLRAAAVVVAAAAAFTGTASPATADPAKPVVGGAALASKKTVVGQGATIPPNVSAKGWVVADADTGEVLAARDAHGRYLPASTMKTLTAVALLPDVNLKAYYTPTFAEVNIEGSKVGLNQKVRYPVGKLMEAMLVVSGNDAAAALAGSAGGIDPTVTKMNTTAKRLQAFDTVARNPSGLDAPGQVTSAYDLALIAREGLRNPQFVKYVTTLRDHMPAPGGKRFEIYNHNKLLTRYKGAVGVKTGYTIAARHTYVGAARRNGRTLVVTLLKAETIYPDATALLDWGFASAGKVVPVGRLVDPVPDPAVDERAERSRPAVASPAPAALPKHDDGGDGGRDVPVLPVALAGAAAGAIVLRRRAVRRRYLGGGSELSLRLPIR
jgi:D-alanyl-D-alanine carboxypeptidase (penicillin-binding protein 5/6)